MTTPQERAPAGRPVADPTAPPSDLNPGLKQEHDPNYGHAHQATDFVETISVQREEGRAWPAIWAVTFVVCVVVTLLLLVF